MLVLTTTDPPRKACVTPRARLFKKNNSLSRGRATCVQRVKWGDGVAGHDPRRSPPVSGQGVPRAALGLKKQHAHELEITPV